MRTWPEALLQTFPPQPPPLPGEEGSGRVYAYIQPKRPWWRFPDIVRSEGVADHYKVIGRRSDGAYIGQFNKRDLTGYGAARKGCLVSRKVPRGSSWQAVRAEIAAEIDALDPMAHPGFRPGQVWALEFPSMCCTGVLDSLLPPTAQLLFTGAVMEFDPSRPMWTFGGQKLNLASFEHLFLARPVVRPDPFAVVGKPPVPYLIADPTCPWTAPWAPSVEVQPPAS